MDKSGELGRSQGWACLVQTFPEDLRQCFKLPSPAFALVWEHPIHCCKTPGNLRIPNRWQSNVEKAGMLIGSVLKWEKEPWNISVLSQVFQQGLKCLETPQLGDLPGTSQVSPHRSWAWELGQRASNNLLRSWIFSFLAWVTGGTGCAWGQSCTFALRLHSTPEHQLYPSASSPDFSPLILGICSVTAALFQNLSSKNLFETCEGDIFKQGGKTRPSNKHRSPPCVSIPSSQKCFHIRFLFQLQ